MKKFVFGAFIKQGDVSVEDGGCAKIVRLNGACIENLFIRLQSWNDDKEHPEFDYLIGRRVRVTIETED
jgi:hypothetical protein